MTLQRGEGKDYTSETTCMSTYKDKGKGHPRTGHESPGGSKI